MENQSRYIIFGAGAIGIAVGGVMLNAGLPVTFVTRAVFAEALDKGIRVRQAGEEFIVRSQAVTSADELTPENNDVVIITTKSQATASVIEDIASVYDKATPVICLQNGIRNEAIARERFDNVYAALVMMSAVQLQPDLITMPRSRSLAIGCYPEGIDVTARQIADDLNGAGLEVTASAYTMAMKWGKLIANLNNATHTITGYWLEQGMADRDMRELTLAVREEGLRVLEAARIEVEPPEGEPSPIRILKMTEALRLPPDPSIDPLALPESQRSYPSMWQDLRLGRKSNEAEFLNGEIIELGRKFGVPTPYNSALLELVNKMFAEGQPPGIYTPAELHALIRSQWVNQL